MDLHTWLDKPENQGKASWLADQLGRSKTAVSLSRDNGVPVALIPQVVALVGGEVTAEDMLKHTMARAVERQQAA